MYSTLPSTFCKKRSPRPAQKRDHCAESRPGLPLIYSDWGKLRHVLLNSDEQCRKFPRTKGIVELAARICEDGKHVQIAVTDHGIGIAREDLDSIFDRFSQTVTGETRIQGEAAWDSISCERVRTAPRRRGSR